MNLMQVELDGDKFWSYDMYGHRIVVGRSESAYHALEEAATAAADKAEDYYARLADAGLVKKQRTQEEINADLEAKVDGILAALSRMTAGGVNGTEAAEEDGIKAGDKKRNR